MGWLIATYRPVSLFSLRASQATSSGGRTNLVPTMYAVKMALIDVAFRSGEDGSKLFPLVKSLPVRFEPPEEAVVSNTFIKIRREPKQKSPDGPAYIPTVGFREFCHYRGELRIAFDAKILGEPGQARLMELLPRLNYLGKRGSFFQFVSIGDLEELPLSFGRPLDDGAMDFPLDTVIQYLDDFGDQATWQRVNSYSDDTPKLGRDRVFVPMAFPYRRVASSRGYTRYLRTV
ncbi:hypothetical protein SY88_10070 [Clostridiales bacterium PH28_bin88]|nr:hypothetical protein SY88_10070 [Clostridiales bacterium PH28_bin88]